MAKSSEAPVDFLAAFVHVQTHFAAVFFIVTPSQINANHVFAASVRGKAESIDAGLESIV